MSPYDRLSVMQHRRRASQGGGRRGARRCRALRLRCMLHALWLGGASLAIVPVQAANWELQPRVATGYRYSDNYRLGLPGTEIEVSGGELDAAVTLGTVDPRTRFEITPRIRATYFPDEREEDSTDYFVDALLFDETPRRRTGVGASFSRQDVVRSELPGPEIDLGLGQPEIGDSGNTLRRNRRDLFRVAPYWEYDLSQRHVLELMAQYTDASFDNHFEGQQVDWSELVGSAGFGFRVSPRSLLLVRAVASRYETTRTADGYGGELEWRTVVSELSRFYMRLGGQRTEPEQGESHTSVVAGIGGDWTGQRNRLFLDLLRSIDPVAAGEIVERYQLKLRLEHDVSQRVAWLVGARALRDDPIDDASTYPRREYLTAETGFELRLHRAWAMRATYNYVWQEYSDEPDDASSNGVFVSLVYEPRRAE